MIKKFFTSGEAAKICRLGRSTIKRWVEKGALDIYRTPGGDMRIKRSSLVAFIKRHNLPGEDLLKDKNKILVVGRHGLAETLEKESCLSDRFVMLAASSDFETALLLVREKPSVVVLEMPLPRETVKKITSTMANQENLKRSELLVVGDEPGDAAGIDSGVTPVRCTNEEAAEKLREILRKFEDVL